MGTDTGAETGAEKNQNADAMDILRRPAELRRELSILRERYAERRAMCERMTARYDNTRIKSGASNNRGENILLNLADLDAKIQDCQSRLSASERDADLILNHIKNAFDKTGVRDAEILRLRDCQELSWREILDRFHSLGYAATERGLRGWRRDAIRRLEKIKIKINRDFEKI